MENIYYMSTGYPVGLGKKDKNNFYYNIELAGNLVGLSSVCYNIWKYCFFDMKSYSNVLDHMQKLNITQNQVNKELETLIHHKVLIKINALDFDDIYNKLKILTPMKNGFGVGIDVNENKITIINQGQEFVITESQFNLWAICDNRTMIVDIIKKYSIIYNVEEKLIKNKILNDLLYLKTIDLLRFNKREKRVVYE